MVSLKQRGRSISRKTLSVTQNFFGLSTRKAMRRTTRFFLSTVGDHPRSAVGEFLQTSESIQSSHRQESHFPRLRTEVKSSETLFLLGSGPSIGTMKEAQWEAVKHNDSWGFNQWFRHAHVPTMYIWQGFGKSSATESAIATLAHRRDDYKGSFFTVRGDQFNRTDFSSSSLGKALLASGATLHGLSELYLKGWCEMSPWRAIIIAHRLGFFDEEPNPLPVPKFGATAEMLLSLAIRLRYERVILLGIDMLTRRHFWEPITAMSEIPHNRLNRSTRHHTSVDYFQSLALYAKAFHGISIVNASRESALNGVLPQFEFSS